MRATVLTIRAQRSLVLQLNVARVVVPLVILAAMVACSKAPEAASTVAPATPASTGLERISPPDASKYPKFESMSEWKNPYFVVRDDGIGFVDLANHEVHILTPEQIPAELASLPLKRMALWTGRARHGSGAQNFRPIRRRPRYARTADCWRELCESWTCRFESFREARPEERRLKRKIRGL